ncbi:MAG: MMPL family transporter [Nitrospirae bacterium]|nr:MMPL family transporter [Nitrospirota bacterium]
MASRLTNISVEKPKTVIAVIIILTLLFLTQFPKIVTDTDPKNMLPADSPVRVYNDRTESLFELHKDMIVLGIVNDKGLFNRHSLDSISRLTDEIKRIHGVVVQDVMSLTTVDNVLSQGGQLLIRPIMDIVPADEGIKALEEEIYDNPMLIGRLVSEDKTTTAIYVPLEEGANGKKIADSIRSLVKAERGDEKYYVAGDPVARDTFGANMFIQMGIFSPIAGMIMFIALYLMFRNITLVIAMMAVAFMSIIWSMGALIGSGFPVHIMSSMIPVFLMAIATDSVHIFNEFYFRLKETGNKKQAILDTITVVGPAVKYTALATAAGFGVLVLMQIIPVRVFGLFIAIGTIVIRLMSFSFIPAVIMLTRDSRLLSAAEKEDSETGKGSSLLRKLGETGYHNYRIVIAIIIIMVIIAGIGVSKVNVNNNMVSWFKKNSDVRQADTVMNGHLAGTASAYIIVESDAPDAMKNTENLKAIEELQKELGDLAIVGKTTSIVDIVKRINKVLHGNSPEYDRVTESSDEIAQYLFLFGMSAKPRDLNNMVTADYDKANIFLQLKTWDAVAMRDVLKKISGFTASHPDLKLRFKPAGISYFNMVWNDEVLYDMIKGFLIALVVVFIILVINFRSIKWGIISYLPLLFTILTIYGFVGYIGKDFDMPISVLSALSLGMAVDFAIHFIRRFQQRYKEDRDIERAVVWTASRPGKGILRNAILFASAFSIMIFAPLTPYITVGLFIGSMMIISSVLTILFLPAMIRLLGGFLVKSEQ